MAMERFVKDVRASMQGGNWYAALFTALPLPDICGKVEAPGQTSQKRYCAWFDKYMAQYYPFVGPVWKQKKLTAEDFYALRCAYLHEGVSDISEQRARQVLDGYRFVAPRQNYIVHNNLEDNVLQLQVDVVCEHICMGVEAWMQDAKDDTAIQQRLRNLLTLYAL